MDLGIHGKKAVISGSTAGIGLAIAEALAAEGALVIINGRQETRVAAAISHIQRKVPNAQVQGIASDLGTANGVDAFLREAAEGDILINNLGIFEPKPFAEITDADWMKFFEVNVMSGVRLTRHYLPGMLRNNWGRVIFISSESAQQIPAEMIHYGMTKTAQVAIARGIAEATANTGVTVNSVLVGPTASEGVTGFVEAMAKNRGVTETEVERQFFASVRPTSLLKRFESPEEVAAVVAFLASAQSAVIHGAAVRADGGVIRSIL